MFFDKYYRPERYNEIVYNMENFKNINEFRTHIIQTYYKYPLTATQKLTVMPSKISIDTSEEK